MRHRSWSYAASIIALLVMSTSDVALRGLPGAAQGQCRTFPETGKQICGRFLEYWQANGALTQQGLPISDVLGETSDIDGKTYTVQYFERAVFEYHSENQPPNDVLLSLLGAFLYKEKYPNGAPRQQPNSSAGSQLFKETGKRVGGRFLQYWQQNGGLPQQGYPISDEFQERNDLDGRTYTVQYFERAVFEMHPENQPPYDVLLSHLGTFRYRKVAGTSKLTNPPQPVPPAIGAGSTPTATPATAGASDPHLKPGFPVLLGSIALPPDSIPTLLVGNINADPSLEMLMPFERVRGDARKDRVLPETLAVGPSGQYVPGWPIANSVAGFYALGNLSNASPGLEILTHVVTEHVALGPQVVLGAFTGSGAMLPGWPVGRSNHLGDYDIPVLVDLNGDGIDEIFTRVNNRNVALKADGSPLAGWQLRESISAAGDLDGDAKPELVSWNKGGIDVHRSDGTQVPGFPVKPPLSNVKKMTFSTRSPAIGDVDGDGSPEIIVLGDSYELDPSTGQMGLWQHATVTIISGKGQVEWTLPLAGLHTPPSFALGDMNCDSYPEIVVQTNESVQIFKGDGSMLPGWPQKLGPSYNGPFGPVIGDVDGDGAPDVVGIVGRAQARHIESFELYAYNKSGQVLPGFFKKIPTSSGATPAIADIDADGRNEIIVVTNKFPAAVPGQDELWVFDLHGKGRYGPVEWGQLFGDSGHRSNYESHQSGCAR